MHQLWHYIYISTAVFSSLYALQYADVLPGAAAAHSGALFVGEGAPKLKGPDRVPDASTVRLWSKGLDGSQPATSFLRQTLAQVIHWLKRGRSDLKALLTLPRTHIAPERRQ